MMGEGEAKEASSKSTCRLERREEKALLKLTFCIILYATKVRQVS